MTNKTTRQHLFEVQLNWITDQRGILSAKDASGTLHVETPPAFGGKGKPWTPEHFFLSAISSCFMTTYLAFAHKFKFEIEDLDCQAIGTLEIVDGRYIFTKIDLYPKIFIADESLRESANLALEKTHKYCIISNSINSEIFYHSQVLVDRNTELLIPKKIKEDLAAVPPSLS